MRKHMTPKEKQSSVSILVLGLGSPRHSPSIKGEECMKLASKLSMPGMKKKKKKMASGEDEESSLEGLFASEEEGEEEDGMEEEEAEGEEMMAEEEESPLAQFSDEELLAEVKKRKLRL